MNNKMSGFLGSLEEGEFLIITRNGEIIEFEVGPGQTLQEELDRAYRILKDDYEH
jgi:hypothetical protein